MKNVTTMTRSHVDPHHRRGFLVEGRGAHRLAGLRALHEHGEQHHEDDRADDDDHLWKPDVHVARQREPLRPENAVLPGVGVVAHGLRTEHELGSVLEEERHAERGDERRDTRCLAQPPVREALDHHAEQSAADHRADEHQGDEEREVDGERVRGAEDRHQPVADERPDHEDVAVGEVQELENAVHHRVAERDQRIQRTVRDAGDELGDEEVPVHP